MKLLIVDDEELTRTGVISSIDWDSLGIHHVYQADDGVHGLEAARLYKPDIILCDIRMPRMGGIAMVEKLESLLPNTVTIFMSGYSDKEYLKAAIKLKAINYIEKPLNPTEIREAVTEAIKVHDQKMRSSRGQTFHSMETASRLALHLTAPYAANQEQISHLIQELSLPMNAQTFFTCYIIKLDSNFDYTEFLSRDLSQQIKEYLKSWQMNCIYAEKRGHHIVYFVYSASHPSDYALDSIGAFLNEQYHILGRHFVIRGKVAAGITRAYDSYASAVILLQSSFFFPENSYLTEAILPEHADNSIMETATPEADFADALLHKDKEASDKVLDKLFRFFDGNCSLFQNHVKDIYYKLLLTLSDVRRQMILSLESSSKEAIVDTLEKCFTHRELHQVLADRTEAFFEDIQKASQEATTIMLIKDYISQNYMNETLSVKDISSHVFLSASYVCTYFKNETGQTLNQYLTEYRMEKAKQLLSDPRYKIADISSKVGYSDGNYFGKSFKKYSGLSPSEYREKTLR